MKTFEQLFCEQHECSHQEFAREVFRRCVPPLARLFLPFVGGFWSGYFDADRELIEGVGAATTMPAVKEEIRDYFLVSQNRGFLRRVVGVRISTQRLKKLVRHYLPERATTEKERSAADEAGRADS